MNSRALLFKRLIKRFSTNKRPIKIDHDFYDYQGYKFERESKRYWDGLSKEEVLGSAHVGYDSVRYLKDNASLRISILVMFFISISYVYSLRQGDNNMKEAMEGYMEREMKIAGKREL